VALLLAGEAVETQQLLEGAGAARQLRAQVLHHPRTRLLLLLLLLDLSLP
jgi:hypothetical protein